MRIPGDRYFCVADRLCDPAKLTAIEWGFGSVSRALALTELFAEYTAVDISADTIRGDAGIDAVRIIFGNLNHDLEVATGEYDVAIAMMVIEHLFDPFHSFRELARVTKVGGLVL